MTSYYIFYIFVTFFALVQCQEFHHEETVAHHDFTDVKDCAKREIIENRKAANVKPRERFVVLKPMSGYEFFPRAVVVKRCNGQCPGTLSPMKTLHQMKSFKVHLHKKGEAMPLKCVAVEVMEHTSCHCMCMMNATSCNSLQTWDEANCECPCKDRAVKKPECESKKSGMEWQDESCQCRCASNMICPSSQMWNPDMCECVSE